MGNNLSVRITADVADLQVKFAIAKAEYSGLTAEINRLARAQASGSLSTLAGPMQQLATDATAAKAQMNGLAAQLEAAGVAQGSFARATEAGHGSLSTATREFRALFDELSSGRTRQTPGTLAIIAQRVLGLGPAALGAVAGVAALVGGLGYLAYRAIAAGKALEEIKIGAEVAGNFSLTGDRIKEFADTLSKATNVSTSDANKIAAALARVPGMSTEAFAALSGIADAYMTAMHEDADKAAESLAKIFEPKTSAASYAASIGAVTQAQLDMARAADMSGNASQVQGVKLELLNSTLARSTMAIAEHNSGLFSSVKAFFANIAANTTWTEAQDDQYKVLTQNIKQMNAATAAAERYAAQLKSSTGSPEDTLKTGVETAKSENPVSMQADEAKSKISEMNAALAIAKERGDQVSIDKLTAGLAKAREELSALNFGPVLERMREQMEQVAATWDGTQSGMLAKQLQVAQATLANVAQNSKEALSIKTEMARLEVQERQADSNEIVAQARQEVAAIAADESRGTVERLEAERNLLETKLGLLRQGSEQYREIAREISTDDIAIARETQSQKQAIERIDASTATEISKMKLEAEKQTLDASVAATKQAVDRKYEALRELAAKEFSLDLDILNDEISKLKEGTPQYEEVYSQILKLKQQLVLKMAELNNQQALDDKKAAKEDSQAWKSAVGEIESAESSMVGDLLNRRKSLSQSLKSIGAELVQSEITNDLKSMTSKRLLANQQTSMDQQGMLLHLQNEMQQLQATTQSQAGQTAAVDAGNAARVSSTNSAALASKGAGAAAGGQTVMADAAKAFSGTYASVSQIPYVGWILAPAAAAAAFAAVAAYEGLASLDVGTNFVPQDMPAFLHKGEAVVPAAYNPANGGGGGSAGGGTVIHNHNYGDVSMSDTNMKRMLESRSGQRMVADGLHSAYRRGARPR